MFSLYYSKNNVGPSIDPYGTPTFIFILFEVIEVYANYLYW